jgi:uncharacterized protein YqgC (DUF456 family)
MSIIILIITVVLFAIGIAGIILPVIPSLPIVWIGILFYGICTNFVDVGLGVVIITGVMMIIGTVIDFISGVFGARAYGASWMGVLGAMLGGIVGLFMGVFGFIVGTFFGACIGEYIKYKKTRSAIAAGYGTMIGIMIGSITKIFISFFMIIIFFIALLF